MPRSLFSFRVLAQTGFDSIVDEVVSEKTNTVENTVMFHALARPYNVSRSRRVRSCSVSVCRKFSVRSTATLVP